MPPPPELVLWRECQEYHTLPVAGGLLAQPAGLLRRMRVAGNVWTLWRVYSREPHKATWVNEHPEARPLLNEILEALHD